MKAPVFIRKIYNRITRARFFYVTLDVCPDYSTGQCEMCSYTVRSRDKAKAESSAISKAMIDWGVTKDDVFVVDVVETHSPELIYDN